MVMGLIQVLGALLVFTLSPLVGGLPLSGWVTQTVSGVKLSRVGTTNVGVSAAFYHGGKLAGILAVLLEATKGIAVVLLARQFFPAEPVWEIIALIGLVMGRYWFARGAGTTNVVWGFVIHDPITALLTLLISGLGFTLFRQRRQGRSLVLVLLPLITALRYLQDAAQVGAVACLSGLIAWIYHKLPDDLDLPVTAGRLESRSMFRFFRGDRSLVCLDRPLDPARYGSKAATLGQLRAWGYAVPPGYVIEAGDDLAPLLAITDPSPQRPVVVRSSAPGEDGDRLSAAGVYQSFLDITDGDRLTQAILQCFASYTHPQALQYRQDHDLGEGAMAVIVQQQVRGQFSGVAFSRDPVARWGDGVLIEALAGGADRVVSGQVTPEQYRVVVQADDLPTSAELSAGGDWHLPAALSLTVEGQGTVPSLLLQQVAYLARHLEVRYQGVPQDLEWSFDGETLWLLQSRPITNLQPIWTRKIAAEVIPGAIRPLTWSINRPLTCGVWGEIFTLVLGNRAQGLDFGATATLHHAHAYFNATLLGQIFRRMGLPPESLEFLTRGAKFSRPPLGATLANLPGLLRLLGREWGLPRAFDRADREQFQPALAALAQTPPETLTAPTLLDRVETILALLRQVTAYNILAPLSAALRSTLLGTPLDQLDGGQNDEVRAIADLRQLAAELGPQLSEQQRQALARGQDLRSLSADPSQGPDLIGPLDTFLADYGYLSPVGTDIAVPTWREDPQPVQVLLTQLLLAPPPPTPPRPPQGPKLRLAQTRFDLKGRVNTRYNRLLAELRWTILALEQRALAAGWLEQAGDSFFLTWAELQERFRSGSGGHTPALVAARRQQFQADQGRSVPYLVFGEDPPLLSAPPPVAPLGSLQRLTGIGASAGVVEGPVRVMTQLAPLETSNGPVILVVPYTDAGWALLLAGVQGLIAEVGGRLSHGAIIAREYGIPAVMDVTNATQRLHDGQWVRLDGEQGWVEVLDQHRAG